MSRCRAIDARGGDRTICPARELPREAPEPVRRAVEVASGYGVGMLVATTLILGVALAPMWLAVGLLAQYLLPNVSRGDIRLTLAAALGCSVVFPMLAHLTRRRRQAAEAVAACLSVQRCPSCAYDLAALIPEPDGCTICPECGAAWQLPPTAHILPPTPQQ